MTSLLKSVVTLLLIAYVYCSSRNFDIEKARKKIFLSDTLTARHGNWYNWLLKRAKSYNSYKERCPDCATNTFNRSWSRLCTRLLGENGINTNDIKPRVVMLNACSNTCYGVMISPTTGITAGHCFLSCSDITITGMENGAKSFVVTHRYVSQRFTRLTYDNIVHGLYQFDIGIFTIGENPSWTGHVPLEEYRPPPTGLTCKVIFEGRRIVDLTVCNGRSKYHQRTEYMRVRLNDQASYFEQGDSGSPVICKRSGRVNDWHLMGIITHQETPGSSSYRKTAYATMFTAKAILPRKWKCI